MAVFLAYISVVLIWSTTPLAIQWSSDSLSFIAAVMGRAIIALPVALAINLLLSRRLFASAQDWKIYLAASISIFPNMPVVYWSAQFIPSGLVAVIFSLSPFATAVLSALLLKENPLSVRRLLALAMAVVGMIIIFAQQLHLDAKAGLGVLGILLSCFLFSLSSVLVKKLAQQAAIVKVDAFNQATGSLLFAAPGLALSWWIMDGVLPHTISIKSAGAILYLALIGSLLGAALFFYILQHLSASSVSLVTLMTPVVSLAIGAWVADESLSLSTYLGVGLVLSALLIYSRWPVREYMAQLDLRLLQRMLRVSSGPDEVIARALEDVRGDMDRHK